MRYGLDKVGVVFCKRVVIYFSGRFCIIERYFNRDVIFEIYIRERTFEKYLN